MEIKRFICKDLRRQINEPQVLVLTGPPQVGKTVLLHALADVSRVFELLER